MRLTQENDWNADVKLIQERDVSTGYFPNGRIPGEWIQFSAGKIKTQNGSTKDYQLRITKAELERLLEILNKEAM